MDVAQDTKNRMHAALEHYKQELKGIRAGRASPALVESILVEAYNSQMRLKELATILSPEPRQLHIMPFDAHNSQAIVRAIDKANLGVTCMVEGKAVRVIFPELDQNRRKSLIDQCHKKREECKVAIRGIRRDQNEALKKQKVPEDDAKRLEKQIQETTDKSCAEADALCTAKEKEISTI
jgi:ribosome recycling factor